VVDVGDGMPGDGGKEAAGEVEGFSELERLLVRRSTPRPSRRKRTAVLKELPEGPSDVVELMGRLVGEPVAMLRARPELVEATWAELLAKLGQPQGLPASLPAKRWTGSERYAGIERAQLAIVNILDEDERPTADELVSDVVKLRHDREIFSDVIGYRGKPDSHHRGRGQSRRSRRHRREEGHRQGPAGRPIQIRLARW
jgi:hypothetical protein